MFCGPLSFLCQAPISVELISFQVMLSPKEALDGNKSSQIGPQLLGQGGWNRHVLSYWSKLWLTKSLDSNVNFSWMLQWPGKDGQITSLYSLNKL